VASDLRRVSRRTLAVRHWHERELGAWVIPSSKEGDVLGARSVALQIIRSGETDSSYERERQPMPRIGPWQGQLEQFLSAKAGKPSRERLTLIRNSEELRGLGYEGGNDAVRRFARTWSQNRGDATAEACVPRHPSLRDHRDGQ